MSHLRRLLLSSLTAILACAFAGVGALAGTAAAQSPGASTAGSASPTAWATKHSGAGRRRRSHRACTTPRHRRRVRKGHVVACRSHKVHAAHKTDDANAPLPSTSRAARNHPAKHAHAGRRPKAGTLRRNTQTVSASAEGEQSIASVLATTCENTELAPEAGNLEAIDAATLCLVNQERARNNELPLQPNAQLEQAALGHSEEMVSEDYFAHIAPSGLTPVGRVQEAGYLPNQQVGYTLGENIAWGTLGLSTPAAIVAAWIASPEHLANILFSQYRDTAIGVVPEAPASLAAGQPGAVYSQEFGVIVG